MKNKKKSSKKFWVFSICFCFTCLCAAFFDVKSVYAEQQTISIDDGESLTVQAHPGDTGIIVPNTSSIKDPSDWNDWEDPSDWNDWSDWNDPYNNTYHTYDASDNSGYMNYTKSTMNKNTNKSFRSAYYEGETGNGQITFTHTLGWYADEECISIDASGRYEILAPGDVKVEITGTDTMGSTVFSATVYFEIQVDMTNVTLETTKTDVYLIPSYNYGDSAYYENASLDIKVNSEVVLSEDMPGVDVYCEVLNNDDVWVNAELSDNILHLTVSAQEKCNAKVVITIAEKEFQLTISIRPVNINTNSLLLEKGNTKQLKIKGYQGALTWSSTDQSVVSVSKSGVIKCRKVGNAVITAKIGTNRLGCAVSVTTSKLKKVCKRATYIGTNWKYSQPNRAMEGYYDCSSLVWKAYKEYAGVNFGSTSYPGTTATESVWCRDHKRMLKGGYSYKKVNKMKLNPGDIVFKSQDLSNPYTTTYHVEMFTGYACTGYDRKGRPQVTSLWASRSPGYGAAEGSLLARPLK